MFFHCYISACIQINTAYSHITILENLTVILHLKTQIAIDTLLPPEFLSGLQSASETQDSVLQSRVEDSLGKETDMTYLSLGKYEWTVAIDSCADIDFGQTSQDFYSLQNRASLQGFSVG